jgi:RNA 2',3'-cyclic 3'-phosphodiesterase
VSLFLAVWPDQPTIERLAGLARPERKGLRWSHPGHWHVTVAFLGRADPDAATAALMGMAVAGGAEAVLGPATGLLNRTVLVVPASGLDELAADARAACDEAGLELEDRPFRGHLTLARGRPGDLAGLAGESVEARFEVHELDLVRSTTVPGGGPNLYDVLGRRPLGTPRV